LQTHDERVTGVQNRAEGIQAWVGLPGTHSHLAVGLLALGEGANGAIGCTGNRRQSRILELSIPEFQSKCKRLSSLH